jgi:dUTP pyrophosphatase
MKRGKKDSIKKNTKKTAQSKKKESSKPCLQVKKFFKDSFLPEYMMASDVGLDLRAQENVVLRPMEQKKIPTGIAIKIPENCVGLVRDRAGIVSKMNVHTAAGTFDPAYRGEVSVVLVNFADETVEIEKGMRIAQLVIIPVVKPEIQEVEKLDITERYDKGFGSTGMKEKVEILKEFKKEAEKELK